jgi:hypothetical protein
MKKKHLALVVALLAISTTIALIAVPNLVAEKQTSLESCYVGVSFCGNTTAEACLLIDRVKTYTNLFIVQSGPASWNETSLNEICDYAVNANLKIIVYFGDFNPTVLANNGTSWRINWVYSTRQRWGDSFLGVYYYDEPGGIWLDTNWNQFDLKLPINSTYDSAAAAFVWGAKRELGYVPDKNTTKVFVSDYALYWYDYLGSYDVVLAQAGWNHTLEQDIALVRGAATMQNKDWGMMVTWKYNGTESAYLDSGENIYTQMVSAYTAGAKYIAVFNYPWLEGNAYGVMKDEHFAALEKFWKEATTNTLEHNCTKAEAVLVLPRNYGWGMRNPNDKIWGFWGSDVNSPQIWALSRQLLEQYGFRLDMVYDDPSFPVEGRYANVFWWNSTAPS